MILILQARRANFSRLQNKMDKVQQIHKGWRVGAGENRAFELKELIQKFAFQTFCHQSRRAARHSRGGSEEKLTQFFKSKVFFSKKVLVRARDKKRTLTFIIWRIFKVTVTGE